MAVVIDGTTGITTPGVTDTGDLSVAGNTTLTTVLGAASGGTGRTTLTANNVLLGNGTAAVQQVAPGTSGNVLTSDGTIWTSNTPPAAGSWIFLSSLTANNSATIDIETTFNSTYDTYVIVGDNIRPATDNTSLKTVFKIGGVYTSDSTYEYSGATVYGTFSVVTATSQPDMNTVAGGVMRNGTGYGAQFIAYLQNPTSTTLNKSMWGSFGTQASNTTTPKYGFFGGVYNGSTAALSGVRFFSSSGNLTTGNFRLYGIKKS